MSKYWLEQAYNDTFKFNDLAGNTNRLSLADIRSQAKLILEEIMELIDKGVDNNDPVELLDGVVDGYVTLDGMTSKLISLGFDVSKGLKQTTENNMSKFPTSEETAIATVEYYRTQGIKTTATFNASHGRWVIRDENGKIRKPVGFVSNDLSNCVPDVFRKFKE